MNNQQILEKAIQKAVDGGWDSEGLYPFRDNYGFQKLKSTERLVEFDIEHIIFNHDFAKALWGEELGLFTTHIGDSTDEFMFTWQHHLQQMVIADDPIKYLEENI